MGVLLVGTLEYRVNVPSGGGRSVTGRCPWLQDGCALGYMLGMLLVWALGCGVNASLNTRWECSVFLHVNMLLVIHLTCLSHCCTSSNACTLWFGGVGTPPEEGKVDRQG